MIGDYLDSLSGALGFDKSLSRRVRREEIKVNVRQ